jgi:hypothetical protein
MGNVDDVGVVESKGQVLIAQFKVPLSVVVPKF